MSDLLENFHTSQFRGTEYEFVIDISRFYIFRQIGYKSKTLRDLLKNLHFINLQRVECGHLTIFYSKPKFGQIGPKTKISSDLFEILFTSQYLKVLTTNLTSLF